MYTRACQKSLVGPSHLFSLMGELAVEVQRGVVKVMLLRLYPFVLVCSSLCWISVTWLIEDKQSQMAAFVNDSPALKGLFAYMDDINSSYLKLWNV